MNIQQVIVEYMSKIIQNTNSELQVMKMQQSTHDGFDRRILCLRRSFPFKRLQVEDLMYVSLLPFCFRFSVS